MSGYAKRVPERIVVGGIREKGGKQDRMESMESKKRQNTNERTTIMYTVYTRWFNKKVSQTVYVIFILCLIIS